MKGDLTKDIEKIVLDLVISHDDDETERTAIEEYLRDIDSIRFIELITAIENKFDIEINSEDLSAENLRELRSFVSMIEKYLFS